LLLLLVPTSNLTTQSECAKNSVRYPSTRWRTVSDQKRKIYFFESALTPNIFWVHFRDVDFSSETDKVMKLDLGPNQSHIHAGNAAKDFKATQPFRFLGL
jgi:penicillin V acylase-like amidase (Ntn superfamily)